MRDEGNWGGRRMSWTKSGQKLIEEWRTFWMVRKRVGLTEAGGPLVTVVVVKLNGCGRCVCDNRASHRMTIKVLVGGRGTRKLCMRYAVTVHYTGYRDPFLCLGRDKMYNCNYVTTWWQ